MRPFHYVRAADPASAVALAVAEHGVYLAGGTNLVDHLKLGLLSPGTLVDVSGALPATIDDLPDGGLRIGAGVRNSALAADPRVRARYPAVARAVLAGASGQLRNMATTGGNLLQRTRCTYFQDRTAACNKRVPGSGCAAVAGYARHHAVLGASSACVATNPSDLAVALVMLDAEVEVLTTGGPRVVACADLHRLPGDDPTRDTVLDHGDLVTGVRLPPPSAAPSTYRKVRDRASYAFALVSVAAEVVVCEGRVADARIALGGVAHKPWRARRAEAALRGHPATAASFAAAAEAELAPARTVGDPPGDNGFKPRLTVGAVVETLEGLTRGSA